MRGADFLLCIAQVGLTFAGFAGLIGVFRPSEGNGYLKKSQALALFSITPSRPSSYRSYRFRFSRWNTLKRGCGLYPVHWWGCFCWLRLRGSGTK
jgi:hypothetical protein